MSKKGYTGIELLIVIIVLGVATLALLTTTSHAFVDEDTDNYEEIKYLIERQAVLYGRTIESLPIEKNMVITVEDIIQAGYFVANEEGNVEDPRNSKATLNNLKIKLSMEEENQISATIIEE